MYSLYFIKKGNSSFLSTSPFSYVAESVTESPLFNSGFGYSWELIYNLLSPLAACVKTVFIHNFSLINRLAVCVKTAPVFNILQSIVTGNTESSFPYWKIGNARAVRKQRPFLKPEQTGNITISLAHYRRGASCTRSSYITLRQGAQTLAHYLMLGIINLCSSFCRHNTVLTWAQFFILVLRPLTLSRTGVRESLAVNSASSLILRVTSLATVGNLFI